MRTLALAAAAAVAVSVAPAGAATHVSYAFGWSGGNVRPATLTIAADGKVTVEGPPKPRRTQLTVQQRATLWKAVEAQRFFTLRSTDCSGALPDFATEFVTVRTATGAKTVRVHGDCSRRFLAVYAALKAAVGLR